MILSMLWTRPTIDLCLSLFPWARYKRLRSALKLHAALDLRGSIPVFIKITDGKVYDLCILDELIPEPGSFYIMDRGFLDFRRLYNLELANAYFVIRAKRDTKFRRVYSHPVDKSKGLICDQTIKLTGVYTPKSYPKKLRRIRFHDRETNQNLVFLTNNFVLPTYTIAQLYKCRWQIELFFKWIKQHLRIKSFYGRSMNAVKTQIWIAISVYVLIAIIKKRLDLNLNLYTFLQILSVTAFEKVSIFQLLNDFYDINYPEDSSKQLNLFEL